MNLKENDLYEHVDGGMWLVLIVVGDNIGAERVNDPNKKRIHQASSVARTWRAETNDDMFNRLVIAPMAGGDPLTLFEGTVERLTDKETTSDGGSVCRVLFDGKFEGEIIFSKNGFWTLCDVGQKFAFRNPTFNFQTMIINGTR